MSEIQDTTKDKEAADKYLRGEIDISSLTEEQVDLAFNIASSDDFNPQGEETENLGNPEELEKEETDISDKKEEYNFTPADENIKLKEALERENKFKQLYEDRERKLKSLKEDADFRSKFFGEEIKTKVDPNKDYLSDDHLAKVDTIEQKQKWLEQKMLEIEEKEAKLEARNKAKSEQLSLFQEISKLQESFPSLKTSEGFQSIDEKVAEFERTASVGGVAVNRYLTDKSYREAAIKKGYKLNIAEKDMGVAQKIYDVYGQYKKEKDEGYKTSLSRVFKESPDYEEFVKSKVAGHNIASEDALNRRIQENSREVKIMGPGPNDGGLNERDFERIIYEMQSLSMKTRRTPEEEKRYEELERTLENINIG